MINAYILSSTWPLHEVMDGKAKMYKSEKQNHWCPLFFCLRAVALTAACHRLTVIYYHQCYSSQPVSQPFYYLTAINQGARRLAITPILASFNREIWSSVKSVQHKQRWLSSMTHIFSEVGHDFSLAISPHTLHHSGLCADSLLHHLYITPWSVILNMLIWLWIALIYWLLSAFLLLWLANRIKERMHWQLHYCHCFM